MAQDPQYGSIAEPHDAESAKVNAAAPVRCAVDLMSPVGVVAGCGSSTATHAMAWYATAGHAVAGGDSIAAAAVRPGRGHGLDGGGRSVWRPQAVLRTSFNKVHYRAALYEL